MEIIRHNYTTQNVGDVERAASVVAGAMLVWHGLRQKSWSGAGLALLGTGFLRRGITGFCYSYQALGFTTAKTQGQNMSVPYELGVRVDEAVTINRPRADVFAFWRNLENLGQFMKHVESVRQTPDGKGSHWVATGPGGRRMEWDAEIINETEGEVIAWRSLAHSDVANAGSVRFTDAEGGRGTEVRVSLQYNPPGGTVGAFVAKIFGEEPSTQIRNDLKRLKTKMESGVVPTVAGQPVGVRQPDDVDRENRTQKVGAASEESFPASDAPAYTH